MNKSISTRYFLFDPGEISTYEKPLFGYMITESYNSNLTEYTGLSFHTDGTCFRCMIDQSDLSEREVQAIEFISKFPGTINK